MRKIPIKELRGAKDLLHEAVEAGAYASEKVQRAIARKPYAVLEKIRPIAAPVKVVEQVQSLITDKVYQAIRGVNKLSSAAAGKALDGIELLQKPKQKK